jgi:hypothetical protein
MSTNPAAGARAWTGRRTRSFPVIFRPERETLILTG